MKKNFLTTIALMVTAFFAATEIARAADVTFSGQLRTRYEFVEHKGGGAFNDSLVGDDLIGMRMRLNANVSINDSTSAFIQLQSARTWGDGTGSGNSSFTANDTDGSVGVHQAYFTLKNFATLPAELKLGRQEVVLDGHRLFGNTVWTTGAQTHDAIRLTHKAGNHTLSYVYMLGSEGDSSSKNTFDYSGTRTSPIGCIGDETTMAIGMQVPTIACKLGGTINLATPGSDDYDVHLLHANFQGILGGGLSLYLVGTQNEVVKDNDIYTVGFRQAGQLFGIDYRGEYYHQWGDANADAKLFTGDDADPKDIERGAYMFGVRVGKKFSNVMMKPSLTIWYDQLSGTDESEQAKNEWGTFNTLFDTGHKFYGHMDLFLNSVNGGTKGMGLTDLAIKGSLQPMPGWTFKAAYHWFDTEADPGSNMDSDLGTELDLALVRKYNANTVITAGYSFFKAENLFHEVNSSRTASDDSADWVYVQLDVKF